MVYWVIMYIDMKYLCNAWQFDSYTTFGENSFTLSQSKIQASMNYVVWSPSLIFYETVKVISLTIIYAGIFLGGRAKEAFYPSWVILLAEIICLFESFTYIWKSNPLGAQNIDLSQTHFSVWWKGQFGRVNLLYISNGKPNVPV